MRIHAAPNSWVHRNQGTRMFYAIGLGYLPNGTPAALQKWRQAELDEIKVRRACAFGSTSVHARSRSLCVLSWSWLCTVMKLGVHCNEAGSALQQSWLCTEACWLCCCLYVTMPFAA
jgi:hypothetical protein